MLSSCARGLSDLRAAPFSGQAYGLAVLLQPFREPFVAKASHMSAVVSSRERCLRVASSFLERAKLDQRCYRAPEPASELSFAEFRHYIHIMVSTMRVQMVFRSFSRGPFDARI